MANQTQTIIILIICLATIYIIYGQLLKKQTELWILDPASAKRAVCCYPKKVLLLDSKAEKKCSIHLDLENTKFCEIFSGEDSSSIEISLPDWESCSIGSDSKFLQGYFDLPKKIQNKFSYLGEAVLLPQTLVFEQYSKENAHFRFTDCESMTLKLSNL
jgi:hypothetical protein